MRELEIHVPDAELEDLRERLAKTRWPDPAPAPGWDYGANTDYIRDLCEYWRTEYDWRKWEAELNRFDHFITQVDGLDHHFIHARSKHESAQPILIGHGWPGSVFEFYKIIGPLTDPEAHGGKAEDAFHVVCPSMPGYGWSEPMKEPGGHARAFAARNAALMEKLGYTDYLVQGGDFGGFMSSYLGLDFPDRVRGVHLNFVLGFPDAEGADAFEGLGEEDMIDMAAQADFAENGCGYQEIQGTKPQTLGFGLNDSPAGLCAWIVEKFHGWTDWDGEPHNAVSRDEMLTNVMIYWITQSIASSCRIYLELKRAGIFTKFPGFVEVPTACAIFPQEIFRPPRKWADAKYNIVRWNRFERGGHFAALEQPEALVNDIREFSRSL